MSLTLKEKVLRILDGYIPLVSQSAAVKDTELEDLRKLAQFCYKAIHVALDTCENKHPEWRKEVHEMYKVLRKEGVI